MVTQINFTLDFLKLKEELVQSDLNDLVKSAMVLILNEYMEKERDDYMKNQPYDRTDDRHDYRNGYYKRNYVLNIGKIKLNVPRDRKSTRLNSSHVAISYAVFRLQKKILPDTLTRTT